METSSTDDDGESANHTYYNYIYSYRIPVLIIVYLVACTKPVEDGKVKMRPVLKSRIGKGISAQALHKTVLAPLNAYGFCHSVLEES
jgi:hypothetical protein